MGGWGGEPWAGPRSGQTVVSPVAGLPTVSNFLPAEGTPVSPTTAIQFDVTGDNSINVLLNATFRNLGQVEVIHDGSQFVGRYAQLSSRAAIAGGFRYYVVRQAGWPGAPEINVQPLVGGPI